MPEFKVKKGGSGDKHMQKMVNEEWESELYMSVESTVEKVKECVCVKEPAASDTRQPPSHHHHNQTRQSTNQPVSEAASQPTRERPPLCEWNLGRLHTLTHDQGLHSTPTHTFLHPHTLGLLTPSLNPLIYTLSVLTPPLTLPHLHI